MFPKQFGTFVNFDRDFENLEKRFTKILQKSIKEFWSLENQKKLTLQRESINMTYSWDVRSSEWKSFFEDVRKK